MINIHSVNTEKYTCREVQNHELYRMDVTRGNFNNCPVPNCTGGGRDKFGIYRHFCLIHPRADIIINDDGELPKCPKCGMRTSNLEKHLDSYTCKKGTIRRQNKDRQDKQAAAENVKFYVKGKKIERVQHFWYLGRILMEDDNDTPCIDFNLKKERGRWNSITKILKREGANAKCMARFYITVVQSVLLYGADSWTVSKKDHNKLQSFHRRATRYITGMYIRLVDSERWEYPEHDEVLQKCGLFPIETYIQRRRGTLRKYMENYRNDLLQRAETCGRHCRNVHKIMWWKQPHLEKHDMAPLAQFWNVK